MKREEYTALVNMFQHSHSMHEYKIEYMKLRAEQAIMHRTAIYKTKKDAKDY